MVKFLISRPIAVLMSFIGLIALGFIAAYTIPVSLMPDIDIPVITVYSSKEDASARELEQAFKKHLHQQSILFVSKTIPKTS